MIGLLLASLLGDARASETGALTTWSTSAVEAVPFLGGEVAVRAAQHLGVSGGTDAGGAFATDLSFRLPADGSSVATFDLHQLRLDRPLSWGALVLGRQLRLDPRGWLPLDGISLDLGDSRRLAPTVFAGRLFSPEPGQDDLSTWVGGLNLRMRPLDQEGEASRALAFEAGWMGRLETAGLSHSLVGGASYRRPSGANASLDAELRLGGDAPGSRAGLRATAWLGPKLSLSPELRWEDLRPASEISGLRTPMDWLGGEGYAVGSLAGRVDLGSVALDLSGGPVMHMDASGLGGMGRGGLGWQGERLRLGAFGTSAAIDGSWLAGGGLEGGLEGDRLSARAEAGLFRLQPLDGADATIGEARARLRAPLTAQEGGGLALTVDGAVGADRLLRPWARAGLVLEGRLSAVEAP